MLTAITILESVLERFNSTRPAAKHRGRLGALTNNTTGLQNTAAGRAALELNTTGSKNTASGYDALGGNTTGNNNLAVGYKAGLNLTTGSNNIDIGNHGVRGEAKTIRIGTTGTQTNAYVAGISGVTVAGGVGVIIDTDGHRGIAVSSARVKEAVKPMDKGSETIFALQPVTFRYKKDLDPKGGAPSILCAILFTVYDCTISGRSC